jgi:hypothetical protein
MGDQSGKISFANDDEDSKRFELTSHIDYRGKSWKHRFTQDGEEIYEKHWKFGERKDADLDLNLDYQFNGSQKDWGIDWTFYEYLNIIPGLAKGSIYAEAPAADVSDYTSYYASLTYGEVEEKTVMVKLENDAGSRTLACTVSEKEDKCDDKTELGNWRLGL